MISVMLVRPSVRAYQCHSYWVIYVKFDVGDFYKNKSRYSIFLNRIKILGTVRENLSVFYCCRQNDNTIKIFFFSFDMASSC